MRLLKKNKSGGSFSLNRYISMQNGYMVMKKLKL